MFPSCTRLGLLCCPFIKLANEIPAHIYLLSQVWCMSRPHLSLLQVTVIIFGDEFNNEVFVYSVFSSLVLLSLSVCPVSFSAHCALNTLSLSLVFTLRERVSHPHKTSGRMKFFSFNAYVLRRQKGMQNVLNRMLARISLHQFVLNHFLTTVFVCHCNRVECSC